MSVSIKPWDSYTDEDNVDFAKSEYKSLKAGDPYTIGYGNRQQVAGYVRDEVGFRKDGKPHGFESGEQAYIVSQEDLSVPKDQVKHVAVVYQGSDFSFLSPLDTKVDWLDNDLKLGTMSIINGLRNEDKKKTTPTKTSQATASIDTINQVEKKYPNAEIYVYGQSLASMDGQFAVAGMNNPSRLKRACLYEGPNMYNNLTLKEKIQADKLTRENKINNYVDVKDIVGLGYFSSSKAVGNLYSVKSEGYHGVVGQHMWGGYKFDKSGNLLSENYSEISDLLFGKVKQAYSKAAASGNLSGADQIMLDAQAARAILQSFSYALDGAIQGVKDKIHKLMQECEESWQDCIKRGKTIGMNLSESEVIEALAEGGCTKEVVVTEPQNEYRKYIRKLTTVEESVKEWISKMNKAIDDIHGTDEDIAGYFS